MVKIDMLKIIIYMICRWTPNHYVIEAIGHAIRSQFRGPYNHYAAMGEDVQLRLWTKFKVSFIINYNE